MLKREIHQRDYLLILITHLIFLILGIVLLFCGGVEDKSIAYILIFICLKLFWFFYLSRTKKIIEIIANSLITAGLGFIEFVILTYLLLFSIGQIQSQSFHSFDLILPIILTIILIIILPILEAYLMKSATLENIRPIITAAIIEFIFGIILYFFDPKESATISALSALFIFLLTPENSESLFNIKISKYRSQQISILRFNLIFMISIMYVISRMTPSPVCNSKPLEIATLLLTRFLYLLVVWIIPMFIIYFPGSRQFCQKHLSLYSNQLELNGDWNMLTKKDVIVRNFLLNIDGRRVKDDKTIFYLNERLEVLSDDEEKIGKIIIIDSEQIILELNNKEERKSLRNRKKYIKFIKIGSGKYNKYKDENKVLVQLNCNGEPWSIRGIYESLTFN